MNTRRITIFVASPNDVKEERVKLNEIVNEVNSIISDFSSCTFVLKKWENDSIPAMGRAQAVVNKQLKPEECDLFIGVLWSRFGTNPGGKMKYDSGTEEEFDLAYNAWKTNHSPHILIYRCIREISPKQLDPSQLAKLNRFFSKFGHSEEHPGLISEYKLLSDFEVSVRRALIIFALEDKTKQLQKEQKQVADWSKIGIVRIFYEGDGLARIEDKQRSMSNTSVIRLVAHSGFSFIAEIGHRYRELIETQLASGNTSFELILSNPWGQDGLFLSLNEFTNKQVNAKMCTNSGVIGFSNVRKLIEESEWYSIKFKDSISGCKKLMSSYGDLCKVKVSKYALPSTVLITDKCCYVEPYFPNDQLERRRKGLHTFETKIEASSPIYSYIQGYFNFMWNVSENFDVFIKTEEVIRNSLFRFLSSKGDDRHD